MWVPVDGTNVTYERWCTMGNGSTASTTSDATDTQNGYSAIPATESTQISTYGGFYVARFEAASSFAQKHFFPQR